MANTDWQVNLVALVVCAAASPAAAHPEYASATVNRYLEVDLVAPDRLRLAYTELVGPQPALIARKAADTNGDGTIDASETRALGETLRAAVAAGLELTIDGARVTPAFDAPQVDIGNAAVGPNPFSIAFTAMLPLQGVGPHEVRVDDRTPETQLGETELRLEESPATTLLAGHRGATGDERETRFLFRGNRYSALEDRSVTFRFGARAPKAPVAAPPTTASPWRARLVSLAIFLGLTLLLIVSAARRMGRAAKKSR
ncbi:MAG TPA: EF-hand domain-containing protein [Polyangia bacterium]|nr:EF-hand domain-containing protein [Polyangia bacterium]